MKALLFIVGLLLLFTSCNPVAVPMASKDDNFNYRQAKTIIRSQKKVRKKQQRNAQKRRKQEVKEIRALSDK